MTCITDPSTPSSSSTKASKTGTCSPRDPCLTTGQTLAKATTICSLARSQVTQQSTSQSQVDTQWTLDRVASQREAHPNTSIAVQYKSKATSRIETLPRGSQARIYPNSKLATIWTLAKVSALGLGSQQVDTLDKTTPNKYVQDKTAQKPLQTVKTPWITTLRASTTCRTTSLSPISLEDKRAAGTAEILQLRAISNPWSTQTQKSKQFWRDNTCQREITIRE